jgi:hypothetical protein
MISWPAGERRIRADRKVLPSTPSLSASAVTEIPVS